MSRPRHGILLITLFYAVGATLWILFSDLLIGNFIDDTQTLVIASTIKGWGFVGVTTLLLYGVLHRVQRETPGATARINNVRDLSYPVLYGSVTIAIVLIILTGVVVINGVIERHEEQNTARLQAIAKLKAGQIGRWLRERERVVELIRTNTALGDDLHRWRVHGDQASFATVRQQLASLQANTGYQHIEVVDRSGNIVFTTGAHTQIAPAQRNAIERAIASGNVEFSDFYQDIEAGEQHTHLDFVATLPQDSEFVLVMRMDKNAFLFPFLQDQPLRSASAETLLFMSDGDSVLFLNELRHYVGAAMSLHIPYTDKDVLAVQVATGRAALGDLIVGTDYRGEPVSGVAQAVTGTHWYLIAKIDHEEEYAPLYDDIYWVSLAMFLALFAVVACALLIRQRKELHQATARQRDLAEASLDIVFRALPDLFFRIAADGTILDYRARRASDLYIPPEQFLGKRMQDVLPAGLANTFASNLEATFQTGEAVAFEYDMMMPQGETYYEARLASLPGKNELIAVVRDISERRRMIEKLDIANRLYATLSQINQAIVRQRDTHKLFQEICDIAIEFGRFSLAWVGLVDDTGESVKPVAFSGNGAEYLQHIEISLTGDVKTHGPTGRAILGGKSVVFNDIEHNPDFLPWRERAMEQGYRSSGAFPIKLGDRFIGALNVYAPEPNFFDASEISLLEEAAMDIAFALERAEDEKNRMQAEQALRDNEAQLHALIDSLPDLVWLKDPNGVFLFCNPRFERFFGAKEADILGKTDYDFADEQQAHFFREKDREAIAAGGPCINEEELTYANDGHTELVETIKTPMYSKDGRLIGVLGIGRDITDHKRNEAELATHLEELQRWQDVTLGRELRGLELKREINELLMELGRPPRYPSGQEGEDDV